MGIWTDNYLSTYVTVPISYRIKSEISLESTCFLQKEMTLKSQCRIYQFELNFYLSVKISWERSDLERLFKIVCEKLL